MKAETKSIMKAVENVIEMWSQGRKQADETIIELLYLQTKMLVTMEEDETSNSDNESYPLVAEEARVTT
jgi:hypothetical protein